MTDNNSSWRPDRFGYKIWGCEAGLRFPVVKILDYNNKEDELLKGKNPFALVVLSQLKAMETHSDPEARIKWKFNLIKRLYRKDYSKKDVVGLFSFIDWVMSLPEEFSRRFWDDLVSFEEEHKMPYVTSVERIGIEKGIQQGMQQGIQQGVEQGMQQGMQQGMLLEAQEMLIAVLTERFGAVGTELAQQIKWIDSRETLKDLLRQALRAKSLDEFAGFQKNFCKT